MQLRFHGDVPPAFCDPQPETVEHARLKRDQVAAAKAELDARLTPLFKKVQDGEATPEELKAVGELGEQARRIAGELQQAQVGLLVVEEKQAQKDAATKRERFEQLISDTREKRAEFGRLYRECCIALGQFCANVEEATRLANSFINVAGMMPTDRASVAEISENPDPLPALLDSGYRATDGYGWNLRLSVVALKGLIHEAN